MKKILFTVFASLSLTIGFSQTTATNFTATDCASASHTLFTELDAGKVIVICWVMPCGSCISSASTAATTVQGYASSYPGRVKFYIVDDQGNSTCSTLSSWENTNSITPDATFGNAGNTIKMSSYGTSGMPKTVVLGGTSHTVYYNVNGAVTSSALQTAINNALNSGTGIPEQENSLAGLNVFPSPAVNSSSVSYSLSASADIKIELYNILGTNAKTVFSGKQNPGDYKMAVDCAELNNGIYFLKVSTGKLERTVAFSVAH